MPQKTTIKYCRHCGRVVFANAVDCPYCLKNLIKGDREKICPFCQERIKPGAIKCKHCGEFLDGRTAGEPVQQILHIEKAIIAATSPEREVELYRADGTRIEPEELKAAGRLPLTRPARLIAGATEDRSVSRTGTVPAPLPPPLPQKSSKRGLQRPEGPGKIKTSPQPLPLEAETTPVTEPRLECPICAYTVYESDNFCENCGRDLSLKRGQRSFPGPARDLALADYAFMAGAAAPAGFLLPGPLRYLLAALGLALGVFSLVRIVTSPDRLRGTGKAAGAVIAGAFWLVALNL